MSDEPERPTKPLGDRLGDLWQNVLDVVDSLVNPEPELVPVPVRNRRPARR